MLRREPSSAKCFLEPRVCGQLNLFQAKSVSRRRGNGGPDLNAQLIYSYCRDLMHAIQRLRAQLRDPGFSEAALWTLYDF